MHTVINNKWVVATMGKPVMFQRNADETWLLNPPRRYLFNAYNLDAIQPYIESVSDLKGSSYYNPLAAGCNLSGARILVERDRERGLGDLLFLTGPLAFFQHVTGDQCHVDVYALADRGVVLNHTPLLKHGYTLSGPTHYDDLPLYSYHWLIESVTECNSEREQLNVYDALYKQLGFDPALIDPKFKRPYAHITPDDNKNLDQLFYMIWLERKLDLRRTGYYVVAPFSNSTLRSVPYVRWLEIIQVLASRRPVVVVGSTRLKLSDLDVTAGQFIETLGKLPHSNNVVNAIDATPVRQLMALIAKATAIICPDSGPLYMAQGLNTPAVSLWGAHDPAVRIGYDKNYMDLAVWKQETCPFSPCFSFANFPANKCPRGSQQATCEVLMNVDVNSVLEKVDLIESQKVTLGKFTAK